METARSRGQRLTHQERIAIRHLVGQGASFEEAAAAVRCSTKTVQRVLNEVGGLSTRGRDRSELRLAFSEREEISRALTAGASFRQVAQQLGRPASTISREVARNGGRGRYRALAADQATYRRARRPKVAKLTQSLHLRHAVESMLHKRWSPQQISARLKKEYPDDSTMRVSHETIYQSLYVQSRGALRRELVAALRTGRARRRPHGRKDPGGYIKGMTLISDRPAEIADRAVPGHWEGDLIVGLQGKSAVATLVERQTRYVMLARIGYDKTSATVCRAITNQIRKLPEHLRVSLTWDRGKEMARHRQVTVDTGVQVYFCDPHSPWQRGSNENTNGLLRQYLPRKTDLSEFTQRRLDRIAHELNDRPRHALDWMKPSEKFAELLR